MIYKLSQFQNLISTEDSSIFKTKKKPEVCSSGPYKKSPKSPESRNHADSSIVIDSEISCNSQARSSEFMDEFIPFPRSIANDPNWIGARLKYRHVYLTLLSKAVREKTSFRIKNEIIELSPGQFCTSIRKLVDLCNETIKFSDEKIDKRVAERAIAFFVKNGFLKHEVVYQKSIFTITHPNIYIFFKKQQAGQLAGQSNECLNIEKLETCDSKNLQSGTDSGTEGEKSEKSNCEKRDEIGKAGQISGQQNSCLSEYKSTTCEVEKNQSGTDSGTVIDIVCETENKSGTVKSEKAGQSNCYSSQTKPNTYEAEKTESGTVKSEKAGHKAINRFIRTIKSVKGATIAIKATSLNSAYGTPPNPPPPPDAKIAGIAGIASSKFKEKNRFLKREEDVQALTAWCSMRNFPISRKSIEIWLTKYGIEYITSHLLMLDERKGISKPERWMEKALERNYFTEAKNVEVNRQFAISFAGKHPKLRIDIKKIYCVIGDVDFQFKLPPENFKTMLLRKAEILCEDYFQEEDYDGRDEI